MIILLEEPEAWSLMMLISSIAADNAELSDDGRELVRRWRSDHKEGTPEMAKLTDDLNVAMNAHIESKFIRRVKTQGNRAASVKR